jgi:heme oxygenase
MILRGATAANHEIVDAAFGRFSLTSATSYSQFLSAHARILGPLESAVAGLWDASIARFPLLKADLGELGTAVPSGAAFAPMSEARRWGMLYVLEGSRLGGGILAGRVAAGLPVRYLSARHEGGSWGRFGEALELAGASQNAAWHEDVIAGAKIAFARFAESAESNS